MIRSKYVRALISRQNFADPACPGSPYSCSTKSTSGSRSPSSRMKWSKFSSSRELTDAHAVAAPTSPGAISSAL